ncbi:hypothetical protein [Dyella acidisoli]|uniref:Cell wall hydrolase SleB domain-containing protein n=1 Tax=Dyella acidisoli TaxID=1867834 RepID=A0ABQ5XTC4_9GAMM|nr:hypothetical protein [Dyella acidisoli]GLQ93589.1 hypothetical protein GCM10007901_25400 [Dyella acidisoli]
MITLPDPMSVAGIKARLFLCECPAPSDHSYTPDSAAEAINLMDVVIRNRVLNPRPFMATGPSVLAVVQARGQFAGFGGYPNISPSLVTHVQDILNIANNERDQRSANYKDFVSKVLTVANASSNTDPSPGKLVAWRTHNHSSPGAGFVLFKTVLKNDFYYKAS